MSDEQSKTVRRREQRKRARSRAASKRAKRERLAFLEIEVVRLRELLREVKPYGEHGYAYVGREWSTRSDALLGAEPGEADRG